MPVDLNLYNNSWYNPGNKIIIILWYITNRIIFYTSIPYPSFFKVFILRIFGAKIGRSITIKPRVNIKYPWKLRIGNSVWIGENVWIDNLANVIIGNNVCISQNAYLLTGNHDYKSEQFDLIVKEIILENGVWVGANSTVCPGVICKSHSVLSVGSVATSDLDECSIYQGVPAGFKKKRIIK